jgi:hypothetical protein
MNYFEEQEEQKLVYVDGKIVNETVKSILLQVGPLEPDIWLPKSEIAYDGEVGDDLTIELPEWLAINNNLI